MLRYRIAPCSQAGSKSSSHVKSFVLSGFQGDIHTEEAFNFYKKVCKTPFSAPVLYDRAIPPHTAIPEFFEADKKVMHAVLRLPGMFWGYYQGVCLDRFGLRPKTNHCGATQGDL